MGTGTRGIGTQNTGLGTHRVTGQRKRLGSGDTGHGDTKHRSTETLEMGTQEHRTKGMGPADGNTGRRTREILKTSISGFRMSQQRSI